MIDYTVVGKRIRFHRQKKGYTQEQLAFEVQSSAAYLSNIERAVKKPSLQKLSQIAKVLELSIDDLIASPSDAQTKTLIEVERLSNICPESDKKRIINSLFEIITILERNS